MPSTLPLWWHPSFKGIDIEARLVRGCQGRSTANQDVPFQAHYDGRTLGRITQTAAFIALQVSARKSASDLRGAAGAAPQTAVTIQFKHNTVDVRGRRVEEVAEAVEDALAAAQSGSAVFVVHGVGTGRLKAAVLSLLKESPLVCTRADGLSHDHLPGGGGHIASPGRISSAGLQSRRFTLHEAAI
jgi:hypothetical protein